MTRAIPLLVALLAATGCGDDVDTAGRIDLDLAGGIPRNAVQEAWLEFSGLTVEHADGTRVQHGFDEPRRIDLATLVNGNSTTLVEGMELPSGRYEWLHLHLNTRGKKDTYLVLADDAIRELVLASEERDYLRINTPFEVPAGGTSKRTIDFHLHEPLGREGPTDATYALRPLLRSVDTASASHITATATRSFVDRHCSEPHREGLALYVFAGDGITPDDINGAGPDPVTVSAGRMESDAGPFEFHASFLPPGNYTVALTCNARSDEAERDDGIGFFATTGIGTGAGDTATVRFDPPDRP